MTRVAVIGSTGQLGTELTQVLQAEGYHVFPFGHGDIECTNQTSVQHALTAVRPDLVVNAAGFVRVDDCEEQAREAFEINALGGLHIARVCKQLNALCVYISTDYVFSGEKGSPYTEEDQPSPVNVYGASKLAGEHLVQQTAPRWLIVRLASLIGKAGSRGKGGNFVETVIAKARSGEPLRVVSDIRMSPTFADEAARALERMMRDRETGMVHVTSQGSCTWHEFARTALACCGLQSGVEPIPARAYPAKACRPRNSSLLSTRISESAKQFLGPWQAALSAYLAHKGYASQHPAQRETSDTQTPASLTVK